MDIRVESPSQNPPAWVAGILADELPGGPWAVHAQEGEAGTSYVVATPDFRAGYGLFSTEWTVKSGTVAAYVWLAGGPVSVRPKLADNTPLLAVLERHAGEWDGRVDVVA